MTTNTCNLHVTLAVLDSGKIQLYCTGEKSTLYDSWKHWFANGISAFVLGEVIKVKLDCNSSGMEANMARTRKSASVLANDPCTSHAYRGYLIRWSIFTLDKPSNRMWVEKNNSFICWADSVDYAKSQIDLLF